MTTAGQTAGEWTYVLNNQDPDTIALDDNEVVTDVFTIRIADAFGGTANDILTITITGENDAPILLVSSGADLVAVEAGGVANATTNTALDTVNGDADANGAFTFTDDDADDSAFTSATIQLEGTAGTVSNGSTWDPATSGGATIAGDYGNFTLKTDGTWTYTVDQTKADILDGGETGTDFLNVRIKNVDIYSNVIRLQVDIKGANDAPTVDVTSGATAAVTEYGTGPLDAASDDVSSTTNTNDTASGSLTYDDEDGDDTVSTLKVYIERSSTATTTTTEVAPDGDPETFTSVGTSSVITDGDYGDFTFTINTAGTLEWEFELDAAAHAAVAGLTFGTTATAKAWVRVYDGTVSTVQEVSVTIRGTEDKPVLSNGTVAVDADSATAVTGTALTVSDQDYDDKAGFSASDLTLQGRIGNSGSWTDGSSTASFAGTYGVFRLSAIGTWNYTVNDTATNVQALDGWG